MLIYIYIFENTWNIFEYIIKRSVNKTVLQK